MSAREEINNLVKTAQFVVPGIYSGWDVDAARIFSMRAAARQEAARQNAARQSKLRQRRNYINLIKNRQMIPAPNLSRSGQSYVKPRYATHVSMPGSGGNGRYLVGGGRLDVGADGKQMATVGGNPVRNWEDLPSTKMMMAANTPFDFKGEAKKLLLGLKKEVAGNTEVHGMVDEMARNMSSQLKGINSMSKYQQRQLLDQWKSQVNGMRTRIAGTNRNGNSPVRNVASPTSKG